ncbi:DUF4268 domain-containing protein [Hufsiella ginkgonis]|uniref:DUF4268 domain-containing protein n=1 Tax=Hufsiella ginkgonis TaxID=2695274 RepID=A0A7K1XSS9_9SPHI|nr:DUF4268 domain-containing protein [Hufsiella ginkgonis]MXV13928.1 DUF4268 domain-containing protein [Hufsiella ginkgonis]
MYSREEASKIKQAFWTAFGQYIAPQPSAEGLKINWINYKTGIKHIYFKMDADNRQASIAITLTHPDAGIRELFYEQFGELKNMLAGYLREEWDWELHVPDENGRLVSRIGKTIDGVNIFRQEDWPQLISFLKPRIILLDEFWTDARYSFDALN